MTLIRQRFLKQDIKIKNLFHSKDAIIRVKRQVTELKIFVMNIYVK